MKKLMACVMTAMLLLPFNPSSSMAAAETTPLSTPVTNDAEKVNIMIKRLNEIDAMDKSNLSSSEKRALRKEVRGIKREIRASKGVYISVGVLLLIIIILILL